MNNLLFFYSYVYSFKVSKKKDLISKILNLKIDFYFYYIECFWLRIKFILNLELIILWKCELVKGSGFSVDWWG